MRVVFRRWPLYARTAFALGWADFTLKYRGSVLGYFWSFVGPLAKFIVIFHVFHPFVAGDIPLYALYLFLGIIVWEFFAGTTIAISSLPIQKGPLMQRVALPRITLALAALWTQCIIFLTHFAIFIGFAVVAGVRPTLLALCYVPVLFVLTTALGGGVGLLLGSYVLRYRDIVHLWSVLLQVLFWLTPVMYKPSERALAFSAFSFGEALSAFVRFQPLSMVLADFRGVTLYAAEWSPSLLRVLGVGAVCLGIFALGAAVFHRRSAYFLQEY